MVTPPWPANPLEALGLDHPIVLAPLAGGPSTPALAGAASKAGCLGMLGGAYMNPEAIRAAGEEIRRMTSRPFGINLFLPERASVSPEAIADANRALDPYRRELGIPLSPTPASVSEDFEAQLKAVLDVRPRVVSFTFGTPSAELVERLHAEGIFVIGTSTCVREAIALEAAGVDAVVAQGAEAGGHRGTFPGPVRDAVVGTMALVPQVVDRVRVPVIAAGGLMDGRGIVAALALGAGAAQMGTAFLAATESGTHPAHVERLLHSNDESTALTRAFSGRTARGLYNRFMQEMEGHEVAFPVQNALTRDIRQAAARQGRPELLSMWAGQGSGMAERLPVAELVERWTQEAQGVLLRLGVRTQAP